MNRVEIPVIKKFMCDGKKNICASVNIYNEKECLPAALESLKDFPVVFVPDGKWNNLDDPKNPGDGLSYDGSREIAKSFPNVVLIDCGNCTEEAQTNASMRAAGMYGYDFVFQLAADEFIKGDYEELEKNCYKARSKFPDSNLFMIKFEIIHITPPTQKYSEVGRIVANPMFVRLRDIHWVYWSYNQRTEVPYLIKGIVIYHDDSLRNQAREDQMTEYQEWNVPREAEAFKKIPQSASAAFAKGLTKMWMAMDFPPVKGLHGELYWSCGCAKGSDGIFKKLCKRHKDSQKELRYK